VDAPAVLEDRREERPATQLRDAELDVTSLGGQQARPVTVALVHPLLCAFVAGGADHLGGFDLDQLLEHQADRLADQIDALAGAERVEQLGHGRLKQGHRLLLLMVCTWRYTPRITPMAPLRGGPSCCPQTPPPHGTLLPRTPHGSGAGAAGSAK